MEQESTEGKAARKSPSQTASKRLQGKAQLGILLMYHHLLLSLLQPQLSVSHHPRI